MFDMVRSEQDDGDETVRRKRRRASSTKLNGLTEEEALQRLLPDHLCPNLDIVIVSYGQLLLHHCKDKTITVLTYT